MIMFSINEYINSQRYSSLLLSSLCVSFYFCSVELLDQTKPGPQHFVTSNSSKIGILVHGWNVLKHFYANTPKYSHSVVIQCHLCMPRQIKLNNLHFNCPSSLIVVTTNHNVFRHKSLRIICGWIYAGYSEILCDTLYNRAANCWGLGVMRLTSWPPAFPDCHLLLVFQHSLSPRASQYPK